MGIHTKELRTMERKHRQAKLSSKKKSAVPRKTLTKTDIDYLQKQTSFTELDILEWFSRFMDECPQGILTREKMIQVYEDMMIDSPEDIVDNLIKMFNK